MDSQLFFIINCVIGGIFLVWFISAKRSGGRRPTQLRMKGGATTSLVGSGSNDKGKTQVADKRAFGNLSYAPREERDVTPVSKAAGLLFLYNGHDWDAYAVLGLSPDSSLPMVTKKYQELIRGADSGKAEFYEAAYRAILKKS